MTNLIVREWNDCKIRQREDGYFSATDMAYANGKLVGNYFQRKRTNDFLDTMSSVIGIPITELVQSFQGGEPSKQGTWFHPKIAPNFAAWCSTEFEVQVSLWVYDLLTRGTVSIGEPESRRFSVSEINAMIKQVDLMDKLQKKGQKHLATKILNELETQWGVEPTVCYSVNLIEDVTLTSVQDWFLESTNPSDPWYAPSGERITMNNVYNLYVNYCVHHRATPVKRKIAIQTLINLGAQRIDSNYIYIILPPRPTAAE